jgi:hypothetical protein
MKRHWLSFGGDTEGTVTDRERQAIFVLKLITSFEIFEIT